MNMYVDTVNELDPEVKILAAAKSVFIRKGLDGATMQEIADEAHISRTSLHYYFRNKDKLFEIIFTESLNKLTPKFNEIIDMPVSLFKKVDFFVDNYVNVLIDNPTLPSLIVHELSRNPKSIVDILKTKGVKLDKLFIQFEIEKMQGKIKDFSITHFIVNIISLCVFPFLAKPLLDEFLFDNDKVPFNAFLEERKKVISEMIILSIKKEGWNNEETY